MSYAIRIVAISGCDDLLNEKSSRLLDEWRAYPASMAGSSIEVAPCERYRLQSEQCASGNFWNDVNCN